MPNHNYAIELTLVLYHDDAWVKKYTYYNHGESAPYGSVKSDAIGSPLVLDMADFTGYVNALAAWENHVIHVVKPINAIPKDAVPDTPVEYKVEIVGTETRYQMTMDTIDMNITYDSSTGNITFSTRSAIDVSWRGFLFYIDTVEDFLTEITGG